MNRLSILQVTITSLAERVKHMGVCKMVIIGESLFSVMQWSEQSLTDYKKGFSIWTLNTIHVILDCSFYVCNFIYFMFIFGHFVAVWAFL